MKTKTLRKHVMRSLGIGVLLMMVAADASAAGLADILENFTRTFQAGGKVAIALAYMMGLIFFIAGIFALKAAWGNWGQERNKMAGALASFVASLLLVYMGYAMSVAGETAFGNEAASGTANSINSSDYGL